MDEKQTITRLKLGDLSALEVLVDLHQIKAVRTVFLIVGDRALAEDIVQNAFIRAADKIEQFDSQRQFEPWFLRSVVNDAIKAAKRQKRWVSLDSEGSEGEFDILDPAALPEELVETQETSQAIWRALQRLSPKQRSAIVLRYYLGMAEAEMAIKMGSPAGTIKYWLHTARQHLKKLLHAFRSAEPEPTPQNQLISKIESEKGDKR
jgi:RNA polymerase sigma-70 factor (ECF subfamily)